MTEELVTITQSNWSGTVPPSLTSPTGATSIQTTPESTPVLISPTQSSASATSSSTTTYTDSDTFTTNLSTSSTSNMAYPWPTPTSSSPPVTQPLPGSSTTEGNTQSSSQIFTGLPSASPSYLATSTRASFVNSTGRTSPSISAVVSGSHGISHIDIIALTLGITAASLAACVAAWYVYRRWKVMREVAGCALRSDAAQEPKHGGGALFPNPSLTTCLFCSHADDGQTTDGAPSTGGVLFIGTPRQSSLSPGAARSHAPGDARERNSRSHLSDPFTDRHLSARPSTASFYSVCGSEETPRPPVQRNIESPKDPSVHSRLSLPSATRQRHTDRPSQRDSYRETCVLLMNEPPPVTSHLSQHEDTAGVQPRTMRLVDSGRRFRYDPTISGTSADFLELPPAYTED